MNIKEILFFSSTRSHTFPCPLKKVVGPSTADLSIIMDSVDYVGTITPASKRRGLI